jgi:hypothetical protein
MVIRRASFEISAASATTTVFGVLAGLGGITHGVGEVVQGNVPIDRLIVDSWTRGPIAANMGGEPGGLFLGSFYFAVLTLLLIVFAGASYDTQKRDLGTGPVRSRSPILREA